ncbi:MAG: glycosyltransferase family 4 protein [Chloroflexi bacterium]|nr:glycosyltransferase family 4 protein [Chloroflexota bacterium]
MIRVCYLLLSRTYAMHLYTADLAQGVLDAGGEAHLITVARHPAGLYDPRVIVHPVWTGQGRTLELGPGLHGGIGQVLEAVQAVNPDVVHITGPQLYTPWIMRRLRSRGFPAVHTLHDLDPHPGAGYGPLLYLWNRAAIADAGAVLVHGERYRRRLLSSGLPEERAVYLPLLHGFLDHAHALGLARELAAPAPPSPQPPASPTALFFGRVGRYKGIDVLSQAWSALPARPANWRLVIAGQSEGGMDWPSAGESVDRRDRLVLDDEAIDLFRQCSVLVLPYIGATQSALIAAAYSFGRPVIVTDSGALAEYVVPGETGWVVPEGDAIALAGALREALADPEGCQRMGAAGREWYDGQRRNERAGLLTMYSRVAVARAGGRS